MRNLAPDQSGIAALRHDWRCRFVGEPEDGGNFGDRSRPQHHRRMATEQIPHFDEIGRLRGRIGDGVFVADNGGETRKQGGIDRFAWRVVQFIEHQAFPAKFIPLINVWIIFSCACAIAPTTLLVPIPPQQLSRQEPTRADRRRRGLCLLRRLIITKFPPVNFTWGSLIMAVGKVTISSITKLQGWLWDTHVTGFGARRQTNGTFYYVSYLRNHCSPLHRLRLDQIDRRKIAALLGEVETSCGPASRNRTRAGLSSFFSWCISEGLLETNPVAGTSKASQNGSRERVLTRDEMRALWRSLGDDRFSDTVRLLLLTGQRRNEIGKLQWAEVNLTGKMIMLAPDRTKNSREHCVPLSAQALAILARQPRRNSSGFVFSDKGFQDWNRCKQLLDPRLQIAPWRIHDLRRTCATGMAELGVQPHIIEAVLNHVSGHKAGVAGIYNRARYEGEMRDALTKWADHVEALIVGPRKQPAPIGLMERAFAVARGSKIVPEEDLANLARRLTPLKRA